MAALQGERFFTNIFEILEFRYISQPTLAAAKELAWACLFLEHMSTEMPGQPVSRLIIELSASACSYYLGSFEDNIPCGGHG